MKKSLVVFIVGLMTFSTVMTIHAQEVTPAVPTPTGEVVVVTDPPPEATLEAPAPATNPLPDDTQSPEDIAGIIWAALLTAASSFAGTVAVTALVNLAKVVLPSTINPVLVRNIITVVLWLAYSIAIKFGFGTQFQSIAAVIVPIITTATPLIAVLLGSSVLYRAAKAHDVPLWGFSKP